MILEHRFESGNGRHQSCREREGLDHSLQVSPVDRSWAKDFKQKSDIIALIQAAVQRSELRAATKRTN